MVAVAGRLIEIMLMRVTDFGKKLTFVFYYESCDGQGMRPLLDTVA